MLKAVGFDLDDTIYLHEQFEFQAYKKISRLVSNKYKIEELLYFNVLKKLFNKKVMINTFDKAMIEVYGRLPKEWEEFVKSNILITYRNFKTKLQPNKKVLNLLIFFKNIGLVTVLITNGNSNIQNNKINSLGIRNDFNKIYISDDYGKKSRKPSLKMFEMFIDDFDLKPEECIYIGDNFKTDGICEKIGIKFLHFNLRSYAK